VIDVSHQSKHAALALALALVVLSWAGVCAGDILKPASEEHKAATTPISGKAHYALRDGLRIYLWEKYQADRKTLSEEAEKSRFSCTAARGRGALTSTFRFAIIP